MQRNGSIRCSNCSLVNKGGKGLELIVLYFRQAFFFSFFNSLLTSVVTVLLWFPPHFLIMWLLFRECFPVYLMFANQPTDQSLQRRTAEFPFFIFSSETLWLTGHLKDILHTKKVPNLVVLNCCFLCSLNDRAQHHSCRSLAPQRVFVSSTTVSLNLCFWMFS